MADEMCVSLPDDDDDDDDDVDIDGIIFIIDEIRDRIRVKL